MRSLRRSSSTASRTHGRPIRPPTRTRTSHKALQSPSKSGFSVSRISELLFNQRGVANNVAEQSPAGAGSAARRRRGGDGRREEGRGEGIDRYSGRRGRHRRGGHRGGLQE